MSFLTPKATFLVRATQTKIPKIFSIKGLRLILL